MRKNEKEYVRRRILAAANSTKKPATAPPTELEAIKTALERGQKLKLKPLAHINRTGSKAVIGRRWADSILLTDVFEVPAAHKIVVREQKALAKQGEKRSRKIDALATRYIDDVFCGVREGRAAIDEFEAALEAL